MKIAQAKYDATQEDKDTFDEDFNSDTEDILDFVEFIFSITLPLLIL